MSLIDLIRKRSVRVATAIPAIPATQPGEKAPPVAEIARVAVANPRETLSVAAAASAERCSTGAGESVLALQAEAEQQVPPPQRSVLLDVNQLHFNPVADMPDPDRCCWRTNCTHSQAMNAGEIDAFMARLERFTSKGLDYAEAERLADKLVARDREGDDRRLCLECTSLQALPSAGRWRCGRWQAADVAREALARELVLMLQRCNAFGPAFVLAGAAPVIPAARPTNGVAPPVAGIARVAVANPGRLETAAAVKGCLACAGEGCRRCQPRAQAAMQRFNSPRLLGSSNR